MTIPFFWWHTLKGPVVATPVRHLLADHLEYLRKTGGPQAAPLEDGPQDEEALLPPGEGVDLAKLPPAERLALVGEAAVTLHQDWIAQVLESAPSTFALGLCFVADRGAFLLDGLEPDLAGAFAQLRDRLMLHTQGGQPMAGAELGRAVDALEALVPAVAELARALHARLAEGGELA